MPPARTIATTEETQLVVAGQRPRDVIAASAIAVADASDEVVMPEDCSCSDRQIPMSPSGLVQIPHGSAREDSLVAMTHGRRSLLAPRTLKNGASVRASEMACRP